MKASEFITETNKKGKVRQGLAHSGPYAKRYDDLDTFYDMYRLGVALANGKADSRGPASNSPTVWVRGPEEEEILSTAERAMGTKGTVVVPHGKSEELPSIETVSPVAKVKRNKYGV
jgi:hypothetical protein